MNYLFNDVVITPYFPITWHFANPSLFGGMSIDLSYAHHWQYSKITSHKCDVPEDEIKTFDSPCIYCGFLFNGYGHFILESLAMLWFVKRMPKELPLVFSYSVKDEVAEYQKEVFEQLGIDYKRVFVIDKITRFKNIYIPPAGYALGTWYLYEQQKALEIYESHPQKGKKIYISRRKYNAKRGAVNEDALESILISRGWNIVYPEKLSFHQQLVEFSTAETIFCISGSALHSLVFLKDIKSKFIIISRGHGVTYNMIADAKNIKDYYLLNVPKKNLTPGIKIEFDQSLMLDVSFIDKVLRETNDFEDIDLSKGCFKKPDKVNFDYRKLGMFLEGGTKEEDNILYKIMYYSSVNRNDLVERYICEIIVRDCVCEYAINKIYNIACKVNAKLALKFMEYVLSKYVSSDKYKTYTENFIKVFLRVNKIETSNKAQLYRNVGLYEVNSKNYLIALYFIKMALSNGGSIENRGTVTEIYNKIGLHDEAVRYAEETIRINDKLPWAYVHLAISCFNKQDFQSAYLNINKAFEMNSSDRWIVGIKNNMERLMKKK